MRKAFTLLCCVACAVLAGHGEELHGVDTWAGIRPLPAVVNPVGREESPDLISLRGEWDFVTQPKAFCRRYRHTKVPFAKVDENTPAHRHSSMDTPWSKARKINVPGAWEAQGVGEPGMSHPWDPLWDSSPKKLRHVYMGEGWYRRDVVLPSNWDGKKIWLKIGGVRSQGWFWVNKHPIAWVDTYCGTYKYDITPFAKPGCTNRIVVCVNNALPSRKGLMSNVHRWGGIYRDIELEATPETRIDDAWVRGDFDKREAEAHVTVGGSCLSRPVVRLSVDGRSVEQPLRLSSPSNHFILRLPLDDFSPWSPEHPNLYWAEISLLDEAGNVTHARRERFGVRKIEVRGDSFYLNGRPYFLRGFGDDSVYPLTGLPPPDRETHLAHLKKARAAGFNFVRLHTHCEVPEYFEAADEVGILVQAELPYYTDVPTEAFTFDPLRDLRELQSHYRRYPSFAVYCGGNEGRLGPYVEKEMYAFVKRTDPDRLVCHQDGDRCAWLECDDDEGSNDPGNSDYDIGPRDIWPRGTFSTGRPFVCHEYLNLCVKQDTRIEPLYTGAWAAPDSRADRLKWLADRGLDAAWGDALQDAQHALQGVYQKRGIEWARKDPLCDGYCFWTAVDVVVANGAIHSAQGLFDPFWQTKQGGLSPERFAMFNGTSVVLADFAPECPVASVGDERKVTFMFANYDGATKRNVAVRWTLSADGQVLVKGEEPVAEIAEGNARPVATVTLTMPPVAKAAKAVLRAEVDGTANEWDFWVFPKRARRNGAYVAADAALLPMLAKLYDGVADAASPEGVRARVVVAPFGSKTAAEALARGQSVLTVSGWDGKPNVSLGWWSMGSQVGMALAKDASALAGLPHEGALTPLLFRVVKEGAYELSRKELKVAVPIVVGEGKKDCYLYLGEIKADKGRHIAAFGLDVLSDQPESIALLDGIVDVLQGRAGRDFRAYYTPEVAARKPVRGVMLSQYTVSEDDFKTLKEWGATVARYQMYPVGEKWKGKTSDISGFADWLDWKLGVLKGEVLPLARKYGIPLVVDLHVPPGGRGGSGMKMLDDPDWAAFFVDCWRKIVTRLKEEGCVYAYDLINEPTQFGAPKVCDYLEIQRRAANAIREIDPITPVIVSCRNDVAWCAPSAFKWMKPLDIVNVFYQFHMYEPFDYTHQKVLPQFKDTVAAYPDATKGWDAEGLRRIVAPVRDFEKRYGARIFVGEFSSIAYAKGCDRWIADVGAMLNEYGWDWCYHAFREWPGWSVEHVVTSGDSASTAKFATSDDNPRRRALLGALRYGRILP